MAAAPDPSIVPRHIAIVMDGNGRWAERRRRPRAFGHREGRKAVRATVEWCLRRGVGALTLFAFSSENWRRPKAEVGALMELFLKALDQETAELHQHGVKLHFMGKLDAFSASLRERMDAATALTAGNDRMRVNVAVNYGGRWDIAQAARALAREVASGRLAPDQIDETRFGAALCLADQPPVDLFIRTGGEQRLSNFLLWQSAYAELHFTDTLWPDMGAAVLDAALADFARRERRFGQTSAQVCATG